MGRRKPKIVEKVSITGIADKGQSVGRDPEGQVIFVTGVAPGDVVDVLVLRKKKGFLQGVPKHFHTYSPDRVEPFCQHFNNCGGCRWQHLSYEAQLRHKQKVVENALQRIAKIDIGVMEPILPALETEYYRNKLEFSFSNRRWLTAEEMADKSISMFQDVVGFHRAGAFDKIVDIRHCYLQGEPSNTLRNEIRNIALDQGLAFYDIRKEAGFLRQKVIKTTTTGEVMLIMCFFYEDKALREALLNAIIDRFPDITSLYYCINDKKNDFLFDLDMSCYYGKDHIKEMLGDFRFKLGPKSFFQTNTRQAKRLYDVIVRFCNFKGTETVYDLYTGLGSIAIYVANLCQKVVGVETIAEAVEDAKINASLNEIENTVFHAGDVKDVLTANFSQNHGKADVIITDPPRAGMHPEVVSTLLELEAPKIVYVSCNPATQARDLELLKEKYRILKVQPVDMFPHTSHIEAVALCELEH